MIGILANSVSFLLGISLCMAKTFPFRNSTFMSLNFKYNYIN